jgi:hypothetical protein
MLIGMKKHPKSNFLDNLDLPEGFEEEEVSPKPPPSRPTSEHEIKDSEFADVDPPTEEEFKASNGPRDERDMNEDFPKFARAAHDSKHVKNREAFDLEMRLHSDDLSKKKTFSVYGPPARERHARFHLRAYGRKAR